MQIFARNPRIWQVRPLLPETAALFVEKRRQADIRPVAIHSPYLINLASWDRILFQKSVEALVEDVERADVLGVEYVVTHIGSTGGRSTESGLTRVSMALEQVLTRTDQSTTLLLLENTAGHGHLIGSELDHIGHLIRDTGESPRLGLCLDTCHAFASGYELRNSESLDAFQADIDKGIGLERLKLVHMNDCRGDLGSHADRHEHIGEGHIGLGGFRAMVRHSLFRNCPWILETPRKSDLDDRRNLAAIMSLVGKG